MGVGSTSRRLGRVVRRLELDPKVAEARADLRRIGAGATREQVARLHEWLDGDGRDAGEATTRARMARAMVWVSTTARALAQSDPEETMGSAMRALVLRAGAGALLPEEFATYAARVAPAASP